MGPSLAADRDSWPIARFGEIVENKTRAIRDPIEAGIDRYVGLEHLDGGDLRVRRWGDAADGTTFTRAFDPSDVLFGKRRAYQRKAAAANFRGVCSGDLLVFAPADQSVIAEYLLLVVCSDAFFEHALSTSAGSLSPRTRWKALAEFRFRLPPLDSQRRIVDISVAALDQADAFAAAARQASVVARSGFASDAQSNTKWPTVRLFDVLAQSPESGCSAPESARETGHFVLGLQALSREGYVPGQFKAVEPSSKMLKARLKKGDLLISRSNTRERVGFAAIFSEEREDVSFPDTMMRLVPDAERVTSEFVAATLMSPLGRRQLMRLASGTSASMKKINRKTLGLLEFSLPPVSEQELLLGRYQQRIDAATSLLAVARHARSVVSALSSGDLG